MIRPSDVLDAALAAKAGAMEAEGWRVFCTDHPLGVEVSFIRNLTGREGVVVTVNFRPGDGDRPFCWAAGIIRDDDLTPDDIAVGRAASLAAALAEVVRVAEAAA